MRRLFIAIAIALVPSLALAAPDEVYVAYSTGNDTTGDGTSGTPWATIQKALNTVNHGTGSSNHLTTELFKATSGASFNHVPYKGGAPAITDVLGGQVQVMFVSVTSVLAHIRAGKMRALAVTTRERIPALPDVPPVSDTYPGFEATSWVGLLAPAGTPPAIINRYNEEMVRILNSPEIQKRLHEMEFEIIAGSPKQFSDWIRTEIVRWGKVIKATGAKAE